LFGDAECSNWGSRIDHQIKPLSHFVGLTIHRFPIDKPELGRFSADQDIFRDGQVRHQIEFLVNSNDSQALPLQRGLAAERLTGELDRSGVLILGTRENFEQSRFPGTILAQEGMHFARRQRKSDFIECGDTRERLTEAADIKQGNRGLGDTCFS